MNNSKFLGIILAIIGVICLIYPVVASIWIEIIVGACFVCAAFFMLFNISSKEGGWNKFYYIFLILLYLLAGVIMLANPFEGTMMIMVILGFLFTFEGVVAIVFWSNNKTASNSWLLLLNGMVTLVLGALVLFNLSSGIWFLGMLAGIDLIFTGITLAAYKKS